MLCFKIKSSFVDQRERSRVQNRPTHPVLLTIVAFLLPASCLHAANFLSTWTQASHKMSFFSACTCTFTCFYSWPFSLSLVLYCSLLLFEGFSRAQFKTSYLTFKCLHSVIFFSAYPHTLGFSLASYEDEDVKLRSRLVSTATMHNDGMTHLTSKPLSSAAMYEDCWN